MTKRKGLVKETFRHPSPVTYLVEFETGYTHEVKAVNSIDAKRQLNTMQCDYGFIVSAYEKKLTQQ
jgi:hypothetical protein